MTSATPGSSSATLRFSPDILVRLGEELNPAADQGILELVKNAHDADAHRCEVRFTASPQGEVLLTVEDDGTGMTGSDLRDGWLLLGRSGKRGDRPTELGRLPVGNKGLGRLAALRLGDFATVFSSPARDPGSEYSLEIDWRRYEEASAVEEVELTIERAIRTGDTASGTKITIRGLKRPLQGMEMKRLARAMCLLADPFTDDPLSFQPRLRSPEFEDLEKLVEQRYFEDAETHLIGELDDAGRATAKIVDWKGEELGRATHQELKRQAPNDPYAAPSATFDLWSFLLDARTFKTRRSTVAEVREWLKAFGGIHLYVRGFRISPYGDEGNDWLELNLRRSRSPEERPSTNNAIGRLSVPDGGSVLQQKTDRSGLRETLEFQSLRDFASDCIEWLAKTRIQERDRRRRAERERAVAVATRRKKNIQAAVDRLPPKFQLDIQKAVDARERAHDHETEALRREIQLYRTLSTAGITAAIFAHESKSPLSTMTLSLESLGISIGRLPGESQTRLSVIHKRLERQLRSLTAYATLTLSQISRTKRRTGRVSIHSVVSEVCHSFEGFASSRKVRIERHFVNGDPYLRSSEAALESVVTNLLANGLQALEDAVPGDHFVRFETEVDAQTCTLSCFDSGPGLTVPRPADVWDPGFTTKEGGTGLGLTIVRDTVQDLGGSCSFEAHGPAGGAKFLVRIPILGA